MTPYADYKPLTFHDAARSFADGNDSPRAYLERCLETIAAREPVVKAFTAMNEAGAARRGRRQHRALEGGQAAVADRRHADRHQGPAGNQGHAHRDGLRRR